MLDNFERAVPKACRGPLERPRTMFMESAKRRGSARRGLRRHVSKGCLLGGCKSLKNRGPILEDLIVPNHVFWHAAPLKCGPLRRPSRSATKHFLRAHCYCAAVGFDSGFANLEPSTGALSCTLVTRIVAVAVSSVRGLAGDIVIRYGNFTPLPVSR